LENIPPILQKMVKLIWIVHMQLKVLTLNIMHGRNTTNSIFPMHTNTATTLRNMTRIIDVLKREDADIVFLQEIDEHSTISGNVDQIQMIADETQYEHYTHGKHTEIHLNNVYSFASGTSIFCKYPLTNAMNHKFLPSFPTPRKGFVVADMILPDDHKITLASVHFVWLDYLHFQSKTKQAQKVIDVISERANPIILGGDFNIDLQEKGGVLSYFEEQLKLHTTTKTGEGTFTHSAQDPTLQIDWIFTSRDMQFSEYRVLDDRVSDHLAVTAIMDF